ncbi:MAG: prepilin-type N-terminal cleavage/methylation domain-containing protein [Candidatus Kaelpia imicola]|nr:prepilin-type N-terminal cleavage/methylation domain-containing protein [Candidatus Kaelpia imicola]
MQRYNFLRVGRREKSFTMLEILIAVIIVSILATLAIMQYTKVVEKQHGRNGITYLKAVRSAQIRYYLDNDTFTDNSEELDMTGYIGSEGEKCFTLSIDAGSGNTFTATLTRVNSAKYEGSAITINQNGGMTTTAPDIYVLPE